MSFFIRSILVLTQATADSKNDHEVKGILQSHNIPKEKNPGKDCKSLLKMFSEAVADYTQCTTVFARPIRLCLRCHDKYLTIQEIYASFPKAHQDGNITCDVVLTKQDRLNVIDFTMKSLTGPQSIWSTAMCNSK